MTTTTRAWARIKAGEVKIYTDAIEVVDSFDALDGIVFLGQFEAEDYHLPHEQLDQRPSPKRVLTISATILANATSDERRAIGADLIDQAVGCLRVLAGCGIHIDEHQSDTGLLRKSAAKLGIPWPQSPELVA